MGRFNAEIHRRRSLRLKGYDYARSGAYFVTVVLQDRLCLLGQIQEGKMVQSDAGRMVAGAWEALPERFPRVVLDAFVVMPNHLHGILLLAGATSERAATRAAFTDSLGELDRPKKEVPVGGRTSLGTVIGAFKSISTVGYSQGVASLGWPAFRRRLWQRNYFEHVVRNEKDLLQIRRYIEENPARWAEDPENLSSS